MRPWGYELAQQATRSCSTPIPVRRPPVGIPRLCEGLVETTSSTSGVDKDPLRDHDDGRHARHPTPGSPLHHGSSSAFERCYDCFSPTRATRPPSTVLYQTPKCSPPLTMPSNGAPPYGPTPIPVSRAPAHRPPHRRVRVRTARVERWSEFARDEIRSWLTPSTDRHDRPPREILTPSRLPELPRSPRCPDVNRVRLTMGAPPSRTTRCHASPGPTYGSDRVAVDQAMRTVSLLSPLAVRRRRFLLDLSERQTATVSWNGVPTISWSWTSHIDENPTSTLDRVFPPEVWLTAARCSPGSAPRQWFQTENYVRNRRAVGPLSTRECREFRHVFGLITPASFLIDFGSLRPVSEPRGVSACSYVQRNHGLTPQEWLTVLTMYPRHLRCCLVGLQPLPSSGTTRRKRDVILLPVRTVQYNARQPRLSTCPTPIAAGPHTCESLSATLSCQLVPVSTHRERPPLLVSSSICRGVTPAPAAGGLSQKLWSPGVTGRLSLTRSVDAVHASPSLIMRDREVPIARSLSCN